MHHCRHSILSLSPSRFYDDHRCHRRECGWAISISAFRGWWTFYELNKNVPRRAGVPVQRVLVYTYLKRKQLRQKEDAVNCDDRPVMCQNELKFILRRQLIHSNMFVANVRMNTRATIKTNHYHHIIIIIIVEPELDFYEWNFVSLSLIYFDSFVVFQIPLTETKHVQSESTKISCLILSTETISLIFG